ncbi:ABC transporter ATP-binding protein [Castellaniella sp.]|uniref:ABC transporter ATP-binding protein n=1 Tax=Castellaniella sp. TaxID=1955812 RepID=UPI003A8F997D
MVFLKIEQMSFTYPGRPPVVNGVDWRVPVGEIHCLLGRSGCGKTTLLKLVAGLLKPQSGRILLQGSEILRPGPTQGFMFQSPTLLEWHTALANVLLPVSLQRRPTQQDEARALQLLEQLGLAVHARHHPGQLSGGQQSRVALARALILAPTLLLLDEPFAALDAITRTELQDDLLRTCRERGTTVLFVTHDINEAIYLGDHIALMHDGHIVQDWTIELPAPRTQAIRNGPAFNDYCAQVRAAMDRSRA